MHNKLNGDLNVKIDEMHHLMLSRASFDSAPRTWSSRTESTSSSAGVPLEELQRAQLNSLPSPDLKPPDLFSHPTKHDLARNEATELEGSDCPSEARSPTISNIGSFVPDRRHVDRVALGKRTNGVGEAPPRYERHRQGSQTKPRHSSGSSQAPESEPPRRPSDLPSPLNPESPMMLPLPTLGSDMEEDAVRTHFYDCSTEAAPLHLTRTMTTASQHKSFESAILQDAAVLCQV